MKDKENVASYLIHADEIINTIRGLGEKVEELMIVQKELRSLPLRFDAKFVYIKDIKYNDSLKMYELHGILIVYELRTKKENTLKKEATF
jgi:hypothetical protein